MPIRKRHQRGHGQAAIYITLPDGATLRWENYKDIPLRDLAALLRETANTIERAAEVLAVPPPAGPPAHS
jgi:hypothetical protein